MCDGHQRRGLAYAGVQPLIEFIPGLRPIPRWWIEAREARREQRHQRVAWASRDAVFFAAVAARATYSMAWSVLYTIGAFGNFLASRGLSADHDNVLRMSLLATAGLCVLAGSVAVVKAACFQRELWEAATRRTRVTGEHPWGPTPPDPMGGRSREGPVVPVSPRRGQDPTTSERLE